MHCIVLSLSLCVYQMCNKNDAVQQQQHQHQWHKRTKPKRIPPPNIYTKTGREKNTTRKLTKQENGDDGNENKWAKERKRMEKKWLKSIKMAKATPKKMFLYIYSERQRYCTLFLLHGTSNLPTSNNQLRHQTTYITLQASEQATNQPPPSHHHHQSTIFSLIRCAPACSFNVSSFHIVRTPLRLRPAFSIVRALISTHLSCNQIIYNTICLRILHTMYEYTQHVHRAVHGIILHQYTDIAFRIRLEIYRKATNYTPHYAQLLFSEMKMKQTKKCPHTHIQKKRKSRRCALKNSTSFEHTYTHLEREQEKHKYKHKCHKQCEKKLNLSPKIVFHLPHHTFTP